MPADDRSSGERLCSPNTVESGTFHIGRRTEKALAAQPKPFVSYRSYDVEVRAARRSDRGWCGGQWRGDDGISAAVERLIAISDHCGQ
jgi:hypothetical protein